MVLQRLVDEVRDAGGLLAGVMVAPDGEGAGGRGPAQLAAAGPRAAATPAEYELLMEAIYEGYLLHYATPRIVRTSDRDLALLAGDHLYALGLSRLVELGDVHAVCELADVITLCALAHSAGNHELARAVWLAGAWAVGWGSGEPHARAKGLARRGEAGAAEALRRSAPLSLDGHYDGA
jgi:hypothetical protein